MNLFESLNKQLTILMNTLDATTFQKMTDGFYQFSNFDASSLTEETIKAQMVNFLVETTSIQDSLQHVEPSDNIALFLLYIGDVYKDLMIFDKSLEFYKEALHQREQALGLKHLFTADIYQKIGKFYEQGRVYSEALPYYKKALQIRQELSYVENNLLIAESYNTLAILYFYMKEYVLAKSYIDKTVKIREKILDPNNELLKTSYYNQKFLYKECQPKKDYLSDSFKALQMGLERFFRRILNKNKY